MTQKNWKKYFPHKTPRTQQTKAIDEILSSFKSGKRFFALEAGTGIGKSAVALTVAQMMCEETPSEGYEPGAIFVTTQKLLQTQYEEDFSQMGMKSIKSATNYKCKYKKYNTCADSQAEMRLEEKGTKFWNICTYNCNYRRAKEEFLSSKLSVTNFPYLLTEANFNGKTKPRQLLIIDEAHNVETELSKFIEVSVFEKFAKQTLKLDIPPISTQHQAYTWIKDIYWPKLSSHVEHVRGMLKKYDKVREKLNQFVSLSRQLHMIEGHHQRLEYFLEVFDKENWVFDVLQSDIKGLRRITFKPIDVSQYAEQYLFRLGHRVIFMSATMLDSQKFFEMVGVDKNNSSSLFLSSPFPPKNRPILYAPVGKMTSKEIDNSLPRIAEAVRKILAQHKNEKGIIHTHSYKIANYLKKRIKSRRLLFPTAENRDETLKKHLNSKKPTVIISPSMTEGIDLEGDASRFQIICKVPYPFLGDKLVKKRMNKWKWWYSFQTAKTIIQSIGRSIRSSKDTAVTYIIDEDWERFYSRNHQLFPKDFKSCLY